MSSAMASSYEGGTSSSGTDEVVSCGGYAGSYTGFGAGLPPAVAGGREAEGRWADAVGRDDMALRRAVGGETPE
jgi:hypothetical protein